MLWSRMAALSYIGAYTVHGQYAFLVLVQARVALSVTGRAAYTHITLEPSIIPK